MNKLKNSMRLTPVRLAMLKLFQDQAQHPSADEIKNWLARQKLKVNKTTVYRELAFLLAQGIIEEINFGDGKKRYERQQLDKHHHHFICENCQKIEEVLMPNDLKVMEKKLAQKNKFLIQRHVLEFFGLCQKCQ